jgi:phosphopantothenoylcysteine decarboxylase/phosphopantothenate--cysteine ligase
VEGAGFGTDTNVLTLITKEEAIQLERMGKEEAANEILNEIIKRI